MTHENFLIPVITFNPFRSAGYPPLPNLGLAQGRCREDSPVRFTPTSPANTSVARARSRVRFPGEMYQPVTRRHKCASFTINPAPIVVTPSSGVKQALMASSGESSAAERQPLCESKRPVTGAPIKSNICPVSAIGEVSSMGGCYSFGRGSGSNSSSKGSVVCSVTLGGILVVCAEGSDG
jgi:hypothetical protein